MAVSQATQQQQATGFDPDVYRMSVGEHLDELRSRLIKSLVGFIIALAVCLFFGATVVSIFCKPLIDVLLSRNLNAQLFYNNVADGFGVFIQISLICAAVLASPIIVYQLWQFVAAGLYAHERKYVTRYMPLSIGLLVSGMAFVYLFVLPWTLLFFIEFGNGIPLPDVYATGQRDATTQPIDAAFPSPPVLDGDPINPQRGWMWFNVAESRLKLFVAAGDVRVIPFGSNKLLSPMITLPDYIDLVLGMLLAFGLSFQLPLVVLALARMGIIEVASMKSARSYVYFGLVIAAAAITPGSDLPSLIGLTVPLILLYELGLWLAVRGEAKAARDA
ncbi:MAG TPA: twin-arginine translocase subunit TatC [Tepidisphaeraceae bacterium]|jgi:sec-independent protein translocase protein TatC|nr:twin-arginine translocase subunit TatC [Tepidisphaeraceae bacterium]